MDDPANVAKSMNIPKFRKPIQIAIVGIFIVSCASKLALVARELIVAYRYGTGSFKDGVVAAMTLACLVIAPLIDPISKLILPEYCRHPTSDRWGTMILGIVSVIGGGYLLLSGLMGRQLLGLIYHGLSPDAFRIAESVFIWMEIYAFLMLVATILSQFLNARHHYWIAESRNVILSVVVIGSVFLHRSLWGIHPLIWGSVLGMAVGTLFLFVMVIRYRLLTWPDFGLLVDIRPWMGKFMLLNGVTAFCLGPAFMTQFQLARLGSQMISAHDFAYRIYTLIFGMVVPIILTPYFTYLSQESMRNQFSLSRFYKIMGGFIGLGICMWIGLIIFQPLVKLILIHGAFDDQSFHIFTRFLYVYIFSIATTGMVTTCQYVLSGYRFRFWYSVIFLVLAVESMLLISVGAHYFGMVGIPLGNVLGSLLAIPVYLYIIKIKIIDNPAISS